MLNYILYRIGEFLCLYLPFNLEYLLARVISNLQYVFSRQDRTSVANNLKVIFPGIEKRLLKKYTKGVFINFGIYLANFFKFKNLGLDYIKKNLVIEGREHIDKALSLGKGLIIVSGHIGNWELGGIALGLLGYPVNAVTFTHKHKKVNIFFTRQRELKGLRVIPLEKAVRGALLAFSRNEIVCLMGDRDFTGGGLVMDFFGLPTMIPRGPAVFSLRNKTPMLLAFTLIENKEKFRLSFTPPIEFTPSGEYEKDVLSLTLIYLKQIEDYIRAHPGQWLMFRRFWL